MLRSREHLVTVVTAIRDGKVGLLAITDQRVIFLKPTTRGRGSIYTYPLTRVTRLRTKRGRSTNAITLTVDADDVSMSGISPIDRYDMLVDSLRECF